MIDTSTLTLDDRAKADNICGAITNSPRFEWVCVKEPHGEQNRGVHPDTGRLHYTGRNHYMVRRWPNGDR